MNEILAPLMQRWYRVSKRSAKCNDECSLPSTECSFGLIRSRRHDIYLLIHFLYLCLILVSVKMVEIATTSVLLDLRSTIRSCVLYIIKCASSVRLSISMPAKNTPPRERQSTQRYDTISFNCITWWIHENYLIVYICAGLYRDACIEVECA